MEIAHLKQDHDFGLTGRLVVTLSPFGGKHTYAIQHERAGDLYADLLDVFGEGAGGVERVTLQYEPGDDGKEAGSRYVDASDYDAETTADLVISYLYRIQVGFDAGARFVD